MFDQSPAQQTVKAHVSAPATITAATRSKENPYTKPGIDKCYRCGEPEHKSNECPKRRQVNMADYDEDKVKIETEPKETDFTE